MDPSLQKRPEFCVTYKIVDITECQVYFIGNFALLRQKSEQRFLSLSVPKKVNASGYDYFLFSSHGLGLENTGTDEPGSGSVVL